MKILKKGISFIIISILLLDSINNIAYASPDTATQKPIKAAVFLDNINEFFISSIKKNLEYVQQENHNKIEFSFFDSKRNQVIENENIDKALDSGFDLFVVKPVSGEFAEGETNLNKIMQADMPLIVYLPRIIKPPPGIIKAYGKAIIITGDLEQSGTLEGKILADAWNSNKDTMDKNKDNIMQYVMLQGPSNNTATNLRTKYSIRALNEAGIKTEQLLTTPCNWNEGCAKSTIESEFLTLGDKVEAIISNNDEMAIGAIEALQKYGLNKGGDSKYIPVVGIDGIPQAKELVDKGMMTGTVIADVRNEAKAIYFVGMNLVSGKNPLSGTNFKFDETGITIKTPYYKYVKQ